MKVNKKNNIRLKKNFDIKIKGLLCLVFLFILTFSATTYIKTYSDLIIDFDDDSDYVASGIVGNKVYVNDLEADYYYYMGLNYTDNNGGLPTIINKKIYDDTKLVQVKITYLSDDNNGNKGYVSNTERQDTYIYFKTISINDNNTDDCSVRLSNWDLKFSNPSLN